MNADFGWPCVRGDSNLIFFKFLYEKVFMEALCRKTNIYRYVTHKSAVYGYECNNNSLRIAVSKENQIEKYGISNILPKIERKVSLGYPQHIFQL